MVGTSKGKLVHIDWIKGTINSNGMTGGRITSISTTSLSDNDEDVLDFVCESKAVLESKEKKKKKSKTSTVYSIVRQVPGENPKELLQVQDQIPCIQTLDHGKTILASTESHVYIGTQKNNDETFMWYQIQSPDSVASFSARLRSQNIEAPGPSKVQSSKSKKPKETSQPGVVDMAIGTIRGGIYLYEDILHKLASMEAPNKAPNAVSGTSMTPRKLHWHRGPANAVKWSLDGNYLISGGEETTLIIWQLQTGRKQELPHLTGAIDCLTVSPSGTSYALLLADNSVMVLSTSELQPTSYVSSVQSQTKLQSTTDAPIAVHPKTPNLLVLAVPASQSKSQTTSEAAPKPFLQTFDINTSHSISRQAITRNNATNINIGPEMNRIIEPNIKLLQLSYDGKWLATVEEWHPPKQDLDFLSTDVDSAEELRSLRLETYLKFWQWDEDNKHWVLETRIDSPHLYEDGITPAQVFNLVANPTRHEFTTAGEDGFVRIWRAKTHLRDSLVVRGAKDEGVVTWLQKHTMELESPVDDMEDGFALKPRPLDSCLAYSQDGSTIAAAQEYYNLEGSSIVRLIDAQNGMVVQSRSGLSSARLSGVGLLNRYLIVLSDSLLVWDLVDDVLHYRFDIMDDAAQKGTPRHLAVNAASGTFAVSIPGSKKSNRIAVFNPTKPVPEFVTPSIDTVTALLDVPGSTRYLVLNDRAEAFSLSHRASVTAPLIPDGVALGEAILDESPLENETPAVLIDSNDVEERRDLRIVDAGLLTETEMDASSLPQTSTMPNGTVRRFITWEDIRPGDTEEPEQEFNSVSRHQRANLFAEYASHAMPSISDMFNKTWDLYIPKRKNAKGLRKPLPPVEEYEAKLVFGGKLDALAVGGD